MMLFRHWNPLKGINIDHPLIAYMLRSVLGGRSEIGLLRYSWHAALITWAVMLAPMAVTVALYVPRYQNDYFRLQTAAYYGAGAMAASIFLFPIIDLVTIFYAAITIRADRQADVKFDLLRISLVKPVRYRRSRLIVAQVRAWRVFVIMWAARLMAWITLAVVGFIALLIAFVEDGLYWTLDGEFWWAFIFFVVVIVIFTVMLLLEPFWRFEMLAQAATTIASRFERSGLMWLTLGGMLVLIIFSQGSFAAGVVALSWGLNRLFYSLLPYRLDYSTQTSLETMAGLIPFMMMPLLVWTLQHWLRDWYDRLGMSSIFRPKVEDR